MNFTLCDSSGTESNCSTPRPSSEDGDTSVSEQVKIGLGAAFVVALMSGTYINYKMVRYLSGDRVRKTAIDELILFEQTINILNCPVILMQFLRLAIPAPANDFLRNPVFCLVMELASYFAIIHRSVGGVGIVGMRVLCIKFHTVLLSTGVNRVVKLISWTGVGFTLALTLGHVIEIYFWLEPTMMPAFCYFKILRPNKSRLKGMLDKWSVADKVAITSCLGLNLIELVFFAVIFWDMYRHHVRHVSLCLSNHPKAARKKKRRNVITATGHFTSWLIEILIFGVIKGQISGYKDKTSFGYWLFLMLLPSINYLVFPAVQTLTSEDLRARLSPGKNRPKCAERARQWLLEALCRTKVAEAADGAAAGDIALAPLPNGNIP